MTPDTNVAKKLRFHNKLCGNVAEITDACGSPFGALWQYNQSALSCVRVYVCMNIYIAPVQHLSTAPTVDNIEHSSHAGVCSY